MTDDTARILILNIPTIIASITAAIVALRALRKGTENGVKSDEIIKKTDQIHDLTNSTMSRINAELKVANTKIEGFEKLIAALTSKQGEAGPPGPAGPAGDAGKPGGISIFPK